MNARTIAVASAAAIGLAIFLAVRFVMQGTAFEPGAPEASADRLTRFAAGEFRIGVATDPATPRLGRNRLIVEIRRVDGSAAQTAQVDAYAEMPAMGAMPAMRAPVALVNTGAGRFEGEMNLSMRGEWPLTIHIRDGQRGEARLRFDLATDRSGLEIASGGSRVGGPATSADETGDVITVDNRRRQLIGVQTDVATHRDLTREIRAVGTVTYDERLLSDVVLKFDGYIGALAADYVGASVTKGQVLFTVYSPELLAAQQEYLESRRRLSSRGSDDTLLRAARQRLRLWDFAPADIKALEARGKPSEYVAIRAPRSGTLVARNVVAGSAARRGETLLTVADLSSVWVEADVYEADLAFVHEGMQAAVVLPYRRDRRVETRVEYIYPYLDRDTRTVRVRLTLDNAAGDLKPDMYAEVWLTAALGHRLSVPEQAVIVAGDSRIVFVDLDRGRLRPTRIQTGQHASGYIEVLHGLRLGDVVVTSGNFLIAAETRLKMGIEQW